MVYPSLRFQSMSSWPTLWSLVNPWTRERERAWVGWEGLLCFSSASFDYQMERTEPLVKTFPRSRGIWMCHHSTLCMPLLFFPSLIFSLLRFRRFFSRRRLLVTPRHGSHQVTNMLWHLSCHVASGLVSSLTRHSLEKPLFLVGQAFVQEARFSLWTLLRIRILPDWDKLILKDNVSLF